MICVATQQGGAEMLIDKCPTITASAGMSGNNQPFICKGEFMEEEYVVRRLTPTECAALQGFPKDWCADIHHSDSAEYKLWGNGIALPSILPMMQNAVRLMEEEHRSRGDRR